jgi:tetratricopeptide (TPR) repeat protein
MSQGVRVARSKVIDAAHFVQRAHRLYVSQNRPNDALAAIDRALRLVRNHADALVLRGQVLTALGRVALAMRCFDHAIAAHPRLPRAYVERARLFYAVYEQFRNALKDVERALKYLGRDRQLKAEALRLRGHIFDALNRPSEAVTAYRAAMRLNPSDAEVHEALGDTLLGGGEPAQAIREFDKALRILHRRTAGSEQQVGFVLISKAEALGELGRPLEALRILRNHMRKVRDRDTRLFLETAVNRVLRSARGK